MGWHARPDFLIIGATKAGTSALFTYLAHHPQLVPCHEKESCFFSPEALYGWTHHPNYRLLERLDREGFAPSPPAWALRWYHSLFPIPRPTRFGLYYEASPDYLYFPQTASRIHAYRPEMQLIVLLRDPVERAYSEWNMCTQLSEPPYDQLHERRSFEDAVGHELDRLHRDPPTVGTTYVRGGIYHRQLRRYLEHFPIEQILILEQRELRQQQHDTLDQVCRFLGVPPFPFHKDWPEVLVGQYSHAMSQWARDLLTDFYTPHNEALFNLIGRRFDWARSRPQPEFAREETVMSGNVKQAAIG